jgi:hypothetical protein
MLDLSNNPFQYIGISLTSLQIDGIDWDRVNIEKSNGQEYELIKALIIMAKIHGLSLRYDRDSLKILTMELFADEFCDYRCNTYSGKLPGEISMLMPRSVILSKLGKPTSSYVDRDLSALMFPPDETPPKSSYPDTYTDVYRYGDAYMRLNYSYDEHERLLSIFLSCRQPRDGSAPIVLYPNQQHLPDRPKPNKVKQLFSGIINFFDF